MSKLDEQLQQLTKYANRSIKAKQSFLSKYGNEEADVITPEELGLSKKDLVYNPRASIEAKRETYKRLKAYKENKKDYRLINISEPGEREEYTLKTRLTEFNKLLSEQNRVRLDLGNIIEEQKMYFYQKTKDGRILRVKGEKDRAEQMLDFGMNFYRIQGKMYGKSGISKKDAMNVAVYDLARGTFDSKLANARSHTREATRIRNRNLKESILQAFEKKFDSAFVANLEKVLSSATRAEIVWLYHIDDAFSFGFIYSEDSAQGYIDKIKNSLSLLRKNKKAKEGEEEHNEYERFKAFKAKLKEAKLL